jgi:hypothetical protein
MGEMLGRKTRKPLGYLLEKSEEQQTDSFEDFKKFEPEILLGKPGIYPESIGGLHNDIEDLFKRKRTNQVAGIIDNSKNFSDLIKT